MGLFVYTSWSAPWGIFPESPVRSRSRSLSFQWSSAPPRTCCFSSPNQLREAAAASAHRARMIIRKVDLAAAQAGIITGVLLAIARITGETAPLLFTALNNQFWSLDLNAPMASLPVGYFPDGHQPLRGMAPPGLDRRASHYHEQCLVSDSRAVVRKVANGTMELMERQTHQCREAVINRHLKFFYGDTKALKDIIFRNLPTQVTAFIGPSGCGKSTLLRVLNRMYELYPNQCAEGEVLLDGENILGPEVDLNAAAVKRWHGIPEANPFSHDDFRQHRLRYAAIRDTPARSKSKNASKIALKRAALWDEVKDKLHASGRRLSGGQQQRLCIARIGGHQPELILLDEPCSALDPISTAKIEELINELSNEYTIAIVTHNMQQAAASLIYRFHVSRRAD